MGAISVRLLNDYSSSRQCTGTAKIPKKFVLGFLDKVKTFWEPEEEHSGSQKTLKDPESVHLKTFVSERQGKLPSVKEIVLVIFFKAPHFSTVF